MERYRLYELSIEITEQCVCACVHCSSDSGPNRTKMLSYERVLSLIDEAADMGAQCVSLSGGDPMVLGRGYNQQVLDYIAGKGLYWLWYSSGVGMNGERFDEGWADMFAELFPSDMRNRVIFSLEGYSPQTDAEIVGVKDHWATVVRAARLLKERHVKFEIHVTPMKPNFSELGMLASFALDNLGAERVSFLRFVPQGRGERNREKLLLSPREFDLLEHILLYMEGTLYPGRVRLGCPIDFRHIYTGQQRKFCHAGKDLLLVRPDGDVHCCAGWKNNGGLVLGNVYQQSLEEIWEESPVLKLIRAWNEGGYGLSDCSSCKFLELCHGGCPAQRIIRNLEHGYTEPHDLLARGHDPLCPYANRVYHKLMEDG